MSDPPGPEISPPPFTMRALFRALASKLKAAASSSEHGPTLARGASWSVVIVVIGTMLGFLTQAILTRSLGKVGYGTYAYVLGWINTLVMVVALDFGQTAVRFISGYAGGREWGKIRALLRELRLVVIGVPALVGLGGASFFLTHRADYPAPLLNAFLAGCALFPVLALLTFISKALQGLKRVVLAQAPVLVLRPILFIGLLLAVGARTAEGVTPALAIVANLAAALAVVWFATVALRRALPSEVGKAHPVSEFPLWMRTTLGLLAVSASQTILAGQVDIVVVGSLLNPATAGLFTLALLMQRVAFIGLDAVHFIANPMIAECHRNRSREELQRLILTVSRMGAMVSLPLVAGLALGGRLLLTVFFGPEFAGAYPILLVLLLTALQAGFVGSLSGFVMTMTGHQHSAAWMVAVAAGVYVVLVIPLTASFGAVGTATATFIAFLARSVLLTWYIRTRLRINILPIPWPVSVES